MISRRTALQSALAAAALTAALPAGAGNHAERRALKKPRRLSPGQTIGIIAPASSVPEFESIEMAADIVRSLGFEVRKGANLYERSNYLAGDDRGRAEDVNAMFADDGVDAIFCLRGGYGTSRMRLLGHDGTFAALERGASRTEIEAAYVDGLEAFKARRRDHLLYR